MSQSIDRWWETIKTHYGTLDNFDDAGTVRIMRNQCRAVVADNLVTLVLLEDHPEEAADWEASTKDEQDRVNEVLAACCAWLKSRGLE